MGYEPNEKHFAVTTKRLSIKDRREVYLIIEDAYVAGVIDEARKTKDRLQRIEELAEEIYQHAKQF